ncbi:MAG: sulfite exporter TauE/SafE family protein [Alphaproteobacteria bacterium]|nr:sulfite exporter TauE/SafE family protein [Alphaproteobacteria bacterium]
MVILNCIADFSTSYGLSFSLFLAGLVGGFTHCSGMCAPFVLAQTHSDTRLVKLSESLLLPYHLGRMTTYTALAFVLGAFVNLAFLFTGTRALIAAPILMLAGVLFLVSAFPGFARLFPWTVRLQVLPKLNLFSRAVQFFSTNTNGIKRYFMGVLLGFMPCGLVVSAILAASSAASPVQSALAMSAFAVGTMPALMLVGLGGKAVMRKYPNISTRMSQGAMVVSSMWLFALAGLFLSEYWKL